MVALILPMAAFVMLGASMTGHAEPPAAFTTSGQSAAMTGPSPSLVAVVADSTPARVSKDSRRAEKLLGKMKEKYIHLEDVTVSVGVTPKGEQAVAYYTTGEIVINPAREASLDDIIAHEIWHVIDWRDNERLDWGENIPPSNSADYLKR